MSTEHWCNVSDRGNGEDLGKNTVTLTFCPSQISHGLYQAQGRASVVSPLTNIERDRQCKLMSVRGTTVAVARL